MSLQISSEGQPYSTLNHFTSKLKNSCTVWDSEKLEVIGIQPLIIIASGMEPKIPAELSIPSSLLEAHHPKHNY